MADIGGYNYGNLVSGVFTKAWAVAQSKSLTSDGMFRTAINTAAAPVMSPAQNSFVPNVVEPIVNIPQFAQGASTASFHELSGAVIEQLSELFTGYIADYFPNESDYLNLAQQWIARALSTGGTGLNAHIEDQIWQRDRARILKDSARAEAEVVNSWAARRYPMPPGAAVANVNAIRLAATDKIAQASTEIAIKQATMELENVKFAVESSMKLYGMAMSAASDYIKALAIGPQAGMQLIPSITDSQAKLISAANSYYQSRISVEELRLKASMPNSEFDQRSREKNGDWQIKSIDSRIAAATAAAQSLGTQAASALNSLHASASVSDSSSFSQGRNVGYSYSNDTSGSPPALT